MVKIKLYFTTLIFAGLSNININSAAKIISYDIDEKTFVDLSVPDLLDRVDEKRGSSVSSDKCKTALPLPKIELAVIESNKSIQKKQTNTKPKLLTRAQKAILIYRKWNEKRFLDGWKNNFDMSEVSTAVINGVSINFRDKSGQTILMDAARKNKKKVCKKLIALKADVNASNKTKDSEETPLSIAIAQANKDIVNLLIETGVNDKSKENALLFAIAKENYDIIKFFISKLSNNELVKLKPHLFIFDEEKKLTINIVKDSDNNLFNIIDKELKRRQNLALKIQGDWEVTKKLIKDGADINFIEPPIINSFASCKGQDEKIKFLLSAGANINAKCKRFGNTALMNAVHWPYNPETVALLITNKADLNATNKNGDTALIIASQVRCIDSLHLLLIAGVNLDPRALERAIWRQANPLHGICCNIGSNIDALINEPQKRKNSVKKWKIYLTNYLKDIQEFKIPSELIHIVVVYAISDYTDLPLSVMSKIEKIYIKEQY